MDLFLKFLNNNWITSIITGVLVTFAFEFSKRLKEKKDYKLQISLANTEVFNILESCVPEEHLPDPNVVFSFYDSAAKKYKVEIEHMDTLYMIIDDLIKKVMESNFLSYDEKTAHCARLLKLKLDVKGNELKEIEKNLEKDMNPEKVEEIRDNIKVKSEPNFMSITSLTSSTSLLFGLVTMIFLFLLNETNYMAIKNFIESAVSDSSPINILFLLWGLMLALVLYFKNKR